MILQLYQRMYQYVTQALIQLTQFSSSCFASLSRMHHKNQAWDLLTL